MRVLVTGASGFLGGWVAQILSERGHTVRALVRRTSKRAHLEKLANLELAEGSVEDRDAVGRAMEGVDAVIHSAGLVKARNEAEFHATNVQGTQNLVDAAKAQPALKRFVHVSSLEATGPSQDGSPVPTAQAAPVTAYGRSKLESEKVVLAAAEAFKVTVLRPTAIYGPRDQEILEAFKSVSRGLMPTVSGGNALNCFIYAADCAEACVAAIEKEHPSGSVFHIVDNFGAVSQKRFLELVEGALGKKALIRMSLPKGLLKTVSYGVKAFGQVTGRAVMLTPEKADMLLQHFVATSEEAQAALGWQPRVGLDEGVKLTVQWYRENGWL